ncbi:MAG TPA: LuxR C-terminal-related transcriptional regulator [Tessaracoccus flavescens]|uniref:LuxR C-terminal-related transcriptional regulator n=1 Tax=Tessaracoccus flavescens TaxID=399497 RepID=A0A921ER42_9ACTN|nr:LuxR C-terminal-related transcriptional regulator [Tessaracoccus flavescens]
MVLIGQGLTNADIADELGLTISTVKTYVSRLLLRLDLTNRTTLAARAHEWGIVD